MNKSTNEQAPAVEPALLNTCLSNAKQETSQRCNCCGYLVTDSEHKGCLRAAQQEPAQEAPVAWMVTRAMAEPTLEWAKPKKHSCLRYEPLYTRHAPLDSDTRKMVLELCDTIIIGSMYGILTTSKRIKERLEAGE